MGQNWARNQVFCHFLKFSLLVFLEITYSDTLQQCLTSSRSKIHKKKFWGPNLGQRGQKWAQNQGFFCHFLKFGSLVFLEIAHKDSLQQRITSSRGKGYVWLKSAPKLVFFFILSSLVHQFSFKLQRLIAWNNV